MMVWATFINESWIRKQNQIGNEWLVRNFTDVTTECEDFSYESAISEQILGHNHPPHAQLQTPMGGPEV